MSDPLDDVRIEGVADRYRAGDTVTGKVVVGTEQGPIDWEWLEVYPGIRFEGPDEMLSTPVVEFDRRGEAIRREPVDLDAGETLEIPFEFQLPTGPAELEPDHFRADWGIVVECATGYLTAARRSYRNANFRLEPAQDDDFAPSPPAPRSTTSPATDTNAEDRTPLGASIVVGTLGLGLLGMVGFFSIIAHPEATMQLLAHAARGEQLCLPLSMLVAVAIGSYLVWLPIRHIIQLRAVDELEILPSADVLRAGEPLEVEVVIAPAKPVELSNIELELIGRECFQIPGDHDSGPSEGNEELDRRKTTAALESPRTIEKGAEAICQLDLQVPQEARRSFAPRHLDSAWGVEWRLEATLEFEDLPDVEASRPIAVQPTRSE